MGIMVGSARIDEKGKLSGGAAGDQKQVSNTNDTVGEVSQQSMYNHSKGWYILRPISVDHANAIASNMVTACNNPNLGYDQGQRLGVITYGTKSTVKTECDCSSLVRACVKEATGVDPGNFNTSNEATALENTKLFKKRKAYVNQSSTPVYNGDVLVTKSKGHTVIVTSGNPRTKVVNNTKPTTPASSTYFSKYTGKSTSLVTALNEVGCKDTSLAYRKKIATANNIASYTGTASQNTNMLNMLKEGKLINPGGNTITIEYFPKYTGTSSSITTALSAVGCKDTSLAYRKKIASANNIVNYTGTASQNTNMIKMLKSGALKKP